MTKIKMTEGQTIQWQNKNDRRTDNTMTKYKWQKDRQYNDKIKMTEGQTIQWPK